MDSKPQPIRSSRSTDETTVGMADASEKRRLDRRVRNLACLVVIAGASIGEKIALAKDRSVIGRQADADICLDDELVSRRHSEMVVQPDGTVILRDPGSRNGTYCNERKVTESALKDGDLIWIGGSVLKYLAPDSAESLYVSEELDSDMERYCSCGPRVYTSLGRAGVP